MSSGNADDKDAVDVPSDDPQGAAPESHLDSQARDQFEDLKRRAAGFESTVDAHIEEAERVAEERATEIVAQAERQAREVREEAQSLVDVARDQVNDLMRLRQALFASLRDTLNDFEDAIANGEENRSFTDAAAAAGPSEPRPFPPADGSGPRSEPAAVGGDEPAPVKEPAPQPTAGPMAGPAVEVRVEPLRDLQAARAVERAFDTLPVGDGVHLRSFEGQTALLDAAGVDVNILLGAMRSYFPVPFILRDADPGKLVVQVGEISDAGGA
ncbi:MAG TPA: hypothetical protein VHV53_11005 [Solirubrobacterales bacterium]|jgi:hypothetical protein|nr:hypothetical protein [Solirubrobacterales bacterium]